MDASDYIAIAAVVISIISIAISLLFYKDERKKLTIDQYHRIADKDGALWWLYHMTEEEYADIKFLASIDHDELRTSKNKAFIQLEDMLGMLDEFGSGIKYKLYDYKTFDKLAGKYCKERVTPHLKEILKTYGKKSYKNIKDLVKKLDPNAEFSKEEESPKRSYEVLVSIPDYISNYYITHEYIEHTREDEEFCKLLDKMIESYLHGELADKRVELTEEQIQELEHKREAIKVMIGNDEIEYRPTLTNS